MNKKGFTLVELLAVIVILAVIILIAINAVLPQMERARKNAFADEVMNYAKAAESKYVTEAQEEDFEGDITSGICYSLDKLHGEYVTKNDTKYDGIVIIVKRSNSNIYDKYAFIKSSKYHYNTPMDSTTNQPTKAIEKLSQKHIEDGGSLDDLTYANCNAWAHRND